MKSLRLALLCAIILVTMAHTSPRLENRSSKSIAWYVNAQESSEQPGVLPILELIEPTEIPDVTEVAVEGTEIPSEEPSEQPREIPSEEPSEQPSEIPSEEPSEQPSEIPSEEPSQEPSEIPSEEPSQEPSEIPSQSPSESPHSTEEPSEQPTELPTEVPSEVPPTPSLCPTPESVPQTETSGIPGYNRVFQTMKFSGPMFESVCDYSTTMNALFIILSSDQTFTNSRLWLPGSLEFVPANRQLGELHNSVVVQFTSYAKPLSVPLYNGSYIEYIDNNEMAVMHQANGENITEVSFVQRPYLQVDDAEGGNDGISDGGITAIVLGGLMVAGFAGFLMMEVQTAGTAASAAGAAGAASGGTTTTAGGAVA